MIKELNIEDGLVAKLSDLNEVICEDANNGEKNLFCALTNGSLTVES